MADPARPALARTLAVLTGTDEQRWAPEAARISLLSDRGVSGRHPPRGMGVDVYAGWTTTDPTEAAELLATRGVLPQGWCGDMRRGWHDRTTADDGWGDWEDVVLPAPRSIPDLVAVASLGWPAIQRAEELAREACRSLREYGCPTPDRVVWRVGDRGTANRVVHEESGCECDGVLLYADGSCWWSSEYDDGHEVDVPTARALWTSGLALDRITPEAVVVVVPPVGGGR